MKRLVPRLAGACLVASLAAAPAAEGSRDEGWTPLFDGSTLEGWRRLDGKPIVGWDAKDGVLHCAAAEGATDIYTEGEHANFVLELEWKIAAGGNSGIKYRTKSYDGEYLGTEYQILGEDPEEAKSVRSKGLTGALYDILPYDAGSRELRAPGTWNETRIVADGERIEHWLNGKRLLSVDLGSEEYRKAVAASKFRNRESFGRCPSGRIMLQYHGSEVWFRRIRIRDLGRTPAAAAGADPEVRFVREADRLRIEVGGRPFAAYVHGDPEIPRPYLTGVRAPCGVQVTRNHPPGADDLQDHASMHPGIWVAFGDLGGQDFWRLKGRVAHDGFVEEPRGGPGLGTFVVRNRYVPADGGGSVCTETCRWTIAIRPAGWVLAIDSTFSPDRAEAAFGDQEEMGLGVRLATALAAKSGSGGRMVDAEGRRDEAGIWGKSAAWCDASGIVEGRKAGVTVIPDPSSFRPSWFHARDYGLLVANPFGQKALSGGDESRIVVRKGETLRLRFAVLVHDGVPGDGYDPAAGARDALRVLGPATP